VPAGINILFSLVLAFNVKVRPDLAAGMKVMDAD
jgi:hypothetical protein